MSKISLVLFWSNTLAPLTWSPTQWQSPPPVTPMLGGAGVVSVVLSMQVGQAIVVGNTPPFPH